ncbi:MAG: response regulator [Alphaproteobacteria bacterium]
MPEEKTILVIEDEEKVRAITVKLLESLGYQAIDVENAAAARDALTRETIDLVLSDVLLTGDMNGPEFAMEIGVNYPGMPIVFMSGYPAEAAHGIGELKTNFQLLNKPFRIRQLDQALRAALL